MDLKYVSNLRRAENDLSVMHDEQETANTILKAYWIRLTSFGMTYRNSLNIHVIAYVIVNQTFIVKHTISYDTQ